MSTKHNVVQGECLSVIASRFGFRWQTLWDHADNADLRRLRKSPNVLFPGDVVAIPDPTPKSVRLFTGASHRIVVDAVKTRLRLRILVNGKPLAGEPYQLMLDDSSPIEGVTNSDGEIDRIIAPSIQEAKVEFIDRKIKRRLLLGHLDPVDTISGAQARLQQLGFYRGTVDGRFGPLSEESVRGFQAGKGLEPSGTLDQGTLAALREAYGS